MLTAVEKNGEDHQVGIGEQQLIGLLSDNFGGPRNETQVLALRQNPKMFDANARQFGNFFGREDLLTRFDGDHILLTNAKRLLRPARALLPSTEPNGVRSKITSFFEPIFKEIAAKPPVRWFYGT